MRVATWNVNSIRTRLEQVLTWLGAYPELDVLCLQETKVSDAEFPKAEIEAQGYEVHIWGQKSYNGVALLSRKPLQDVRYGFAGVLDPLMVADLDEQKRLICAELNGVRLINVYVPNGSEVGSDKYDYKLRWLATLRDYLHLWLEQTEHLLICGDFNIAPEDRDIYDPKKVGEIMASDPERQALLKILSLGLQDPFRKFTPDPGYFSWWDYRSGGFQRNRGWRIDHHYLSPPLYARALSCQIDVEPRRNEKPSDHAPVVVEFEDPGHLL